MPALSTTTVTFDQDQLDSLEGKLTILANALEPDQRRGRVGDEPAVTLAGPQPVPLDSIVQDIVATYREGVTIAPQTESRPLIPLFAAANKPVPPELQVDHEQLRYNFYSVDIAFSVLLPKGQYPKDATLALHLTDDVKDPARRTRPIQLFPGRQDINFFRVDVEGAIGIDASMKLAMPLTAAGRPMPFANVSADAKLKAGMVVGPFSFPICRAAIEVVGEQSQDILWRYDITSTLAGANTFKSVLILKVAKEASEIFVDAKLTVTPYKESWALFKEALPPLPASARLQVELVP